MGTVQGILMCFMQRMLWQGNKRPIWQRMLGSRTLHTGVLAGQLEAEHVWAGGVLVCTTLVLPPWVYPILGSCGQCGHLGGTSRAGVGKAHRTHVSGRQTGNPRSCSGPCNQDVGRTQTVVFTSTSNLRECSSSSFTIWWML